MNEEIRGPHTHLEEVTIVGLQAAMTSGELTAHRLTQMYIERISALDRQRPSIKSILEINPEALEIARTLDEEPDARGPRGPLHGIPVLLKDSIATADQMQTTAGSLALLGSRPPRDAFVARRLREAREFTNLSQQFVSEQTGIPRSAISMLTGPDAAAFRYR